jgi:CRP/FNR family cyclic AMP-dependent transcriptional regulator
VADLKTDTQLKHIGLFSGLADSELTEIAEIATRHSYPKSSIIINEGDETDSLYLILSGKVKIVLSDEDGKEVIISILEPGDYFGELSLIDSEPRSARVVTMADCQFSIIHKSDFNKVLDNNPGLVRNLLSGLTKRLRAANKNIESLALMDVYGRVARTLLQFAEDENGKKVITEKLTQKDIANMVGASREMVSRIFKDLTTGGYITVKSGRITINDKLPAGY